MTDIKLFEDDELDYQYVVGQDPGGTTGVAVLRYTEHTKPELVYLHQIPDGREGFFYFFIGSDVGEGTIFTSVSEKWETREGIHSANLEPVYIEGVQYAIWVDQTVYQSPSVKKMVGDEFLKVNNLWTEGKRHQMDALLHAIYYLRSIGHEPTLKALAGELGEPLAEEGEADEKTLPQPGGSGSEEGESGEGGGEPSHGFDQAIEEFMRQLEKSAAEAGEAMKAVAEALGDGDDDPNGSGGRGAEGDYKPDDEPLPAQQKRSLNGAFMGFEDDDE